jgi:hypothetical protein
MMGRKSMEKHGAEENCRKRVMQEGRKDRGDLRKRVEDVVIFRRRNGKCGLEMR